MNLRKDHCRNLHSRTTREHVLNTWGALAPPSRPRRLARLRARFGGQRTPARKAPRNTKIGSPPPRAPFADRAGGRALLFKHKRLSATDISALASMKNVAKCDTWCELQNPVNHRVFERKLRPKPLGRGHVCLGVTHRVAPRTFARGRKLASRAPRARGWPKCESTSTDVAASGG